MQDIAYRPMKKQLVFDMGTPLRHEPQDCRGDKVCNSTGRAAQAFAGSSADYVSTDTSPETGCSYGWASAHSCDTRPALLPSYATPFVVYVGPGPNGRNILAVNE